MYSSNKHVNVPKTRTPAKCSSHSSKGLNGGWGLGGIAPLAILKGTENIYDNLYYVLIFSIQLRYCINYC